MGLFDLFKKKPSAPQESEKSILLTMPLFGNNERYHTAAVLNDLKMYWDVDATDFEGDDDSAVFKLNGTTVALAYISAPIPGDEIARTANYAYNWPTALTDLENYTGHAILSVMPGTSTKPLDGFKLMSMVASSILRTSDTVGIYNGSQSLLTSKERYLETVEMLKEGENPVTLWVYIGIRPGEQSNSVYTYGLKAFNKKEVEIINSSLSVEELYQTLYNITSYVIGYDVTLNHGETIGISMEQKIPITHSKGVYIDGETIKLAL